MAPDKPTRVAVDLLESAAVEGVREGRSAKQQLDHWTRVGRALSMHDTAARRRVEAALEGTTPMATLSADERRALNAQLDASIQAHARGAAYGELLAAEGVTTVALDDEGNLVEYRPDGTTTTIG
jgi:hypothetical protein